MCRWLENCLLPAVVVYTISKRSVLCLSMRDCFAFRTLLDALAHSGARRRHKLMDVFVSSPGQFTDSNPSRKRNITQSVGLDIATTSHSWCDWGRSHSGVSYISTDRTLSIFGLFLRSTFWAINKHLFDRKSLCLSIYLLKNVINFIFEWIEQK